VAADPNREVQGWQGAVADHPVDGVERQADVATGRLGIETLRLLRHPSRELTEAS